MIDTEPEWDDDARDWANALFDLEADRCPGCGHRLSESLQAPGHNPTWAVGAHVCTVCRDIEKAQRKIAEQDHDKKTGDLLKDATPSARLWYAHPIKPKRRQ